jgi:hypothetical protein
MPARRQLGVAEQLRQLGADVAVVLQAQHAANEPHRVRQ